MYNDYVRGSPMHSIISFLNHHKHKILCQNILQTLTCNYNKQHKQPILSRVAIYVRSHLPKIVLLAVCVEIKVAVS